MREWHVYASYLAMTTPSIARREGLIEVPSITEFYYFT